MIKASQESSPRADLENIIKLRKDNDKLIENISGSIKRMAQGKQENHVILSTDRESGNGLAELNKRILERFDEIIELLEKMTSNKKEKESHSVLDASNLSTGYKPDNGEEKTKELTQVAAQALIYLVHPEIPPPPQQTTCFIANLIQNYSPETG